MSEVSNIIKFLSGKRFPLSDETRLQSSIEEELQRDGVIFKREFRLSPEDRIDFLIGRVGVEVKIKGGKLAIYRQVERYAQRDAVDALILVTNVAMGMPEEINGKPVHVFNLGRAWL